MFFKQSSASGRAMACAAGRTALNRRQFQVSLACSALPMTSAGQDETPVRPRPWPGGRASPAITLRGHDGPAWTAADTRGQVVLLNFWASWCAPCLSEMPTLELLEQRLEARRLAVLAVNFRETDAALTRLFAHFSTTLRILRDADGAAARAFGVRIFPSTIALDREGKAAFTVTGAVDWNGDEPQRWLAPLL
jgi:thiol-disulfide isomerase/thioredoxin